MCLSTPEGEGVCHLHLIIVPSTDPLSFLVEDTSVRSSMSLPGGIPSSLQSGYPIQSPMGGTPGRLGWGTSLLGLDEVPPPQSGLYGDLPSELGVGNTPHRDWMGVPPLQARLDGRERAAERVLVTPRSVCLLRLSRRTFLLHLILSFLLELCGFLHPTE